MLNSVKSYFSSGKLIRWAILFYAMGLLTYGAYKTFKHPSLEKFILGSDMEGYYQYLPWFFLHDWKDFDQLPWAKPYGEGKTLSVFTSGTAILQSPFFLAAHGVTKLAGLKADGYGPVYYFSVFLAGLFYATLGMLFLYKALLRWFDPKSAFWSTLLIFYGTNLFYYTIMMPGMSHVYSFSMVAAVLYGVPRFYEKPDPLRAIALALPIALAVLIRPTTLVILLFFILYDVDSFQSLKQRFLFVVRNGHLFMLMVITAMLVFTPQLAYWHHVTGQWIVYSYQEEGFTFWRNPQVMTVLFGKRGGWFTYTPLMGLAMISLVVMAFRRYSSAPVILLCMLVIIYINSSWWAPTFSASAGYRALIEFLPLMAVPLAYLVSKTLNMPKGWLKTGTVLVAWIIVLYNIQFAFKYDATVWWDWEWSYKTMLRLFTF